ncbi:MAG: DNA-binding protein WhiA [Clostridia bacterium]|nr:DNA-binding protein WhiA [Clostridia bacterium]
MSFSSSIKDELTLIRLKDDNARRIMLAALTHTAGSITLGRKGMGIEYVTENRNVGQLIAQIAAKLYDVEASLSLREHERLKAKNTVVSLVGSGCAAILQMSGCIPGDDAEDEEFDMGAIPQELIARPEDIQSFLRGAFLGSGSVSDPSKGYHLEIVCRHEAFAAELCRLMESIMLNAKKGKRKSAFLAYVKEGESISEFLTFIGATEGMLAFENARVMRNVANDLNRRSNFEDANMQKAAQAAAQQLLDIELLHKEIGIANLPPKLREAAEVRINNPEATLMELAEMLNIGKSGMNHRLGKLSLMAEEIRLH